MKFRTKIWMLPFSAAAVFVGGIAFSFLVAFRTSTALIELSKVESPALGHVQHLERGIETFRLMLQTAVVEGDADKLLEVQTAVDKTRLVLKALSGIPLKAALATDLSTAFEAYQSSALGASRAMLGKTDTGDLVSRMQSTQTAIDKLVKSSLDDAVAATAARQSDAEAGVRQAQLVNLITGVGVLLVLGAASRMVVSSVWRDLGEEPSQLRAVVREIAAGNLRVQFSGAASDVNSLNGSLALMAAQLDETVGTIREAAESIATSSGEIAMGSQDLSKRTEKAAFSLQATASSVVELTNSVGQSADSARQAGSLATEAADAALRGGGIVTQVMSNMVEINTASSRIKEIIGVIDGIAFQTNILALNAAVEAARAGQNGRGFAVVATEVRTLAQRSAAAAREIKILIGASSEKVESGSQLVREAGRAMGAIVVGVKRVTDVISEMSAAASEQSTGIGQVNQSVSELDHMTQQNAALVEESAAAAASMNEQSARLASSVAAFRLNSSRPNSISVV